MSGEPPRRLSASTGLGWRNVLARTYADPPRTDTFTTAPSRDLLVVLVTGGTYTIESRAGHTWRQARYGPGSVGVTAPGHSSVLRWRATGPKPMRSLHLYLGTDLAPEPGAFPDTLSLEDPFVSAAAAALGRALDERAPALYADSLAQALAVHLTRPRTAEPATFGTRELRRVTDYMRAHLAEEVSLDELAALASLSKFHFLRMFARSTGLTPHRYLVRLRLLRGADLLRGTGLDVQRVALACGYRSPGQFAAAFRRQHGLSPGEYRRQAQR